MISEDSTGLLIHALTQSRLSPYPRVNQCENGRCCKKLGRFMLDAKTSRSHGETAIIYGNLQ